MVHRADSVCRTERVESFGRYLFPDPSGRRWRWNPSERCNSSLRWLWTVWPGKSVNCKLNRAQSRQQEANELAALRQEVRTHQYGLHTAAGKATSRVRKMRGETGSAVFRGYAGAAVPRLYKLMTEAAQATMQIPNATILEDEDRAASAHIYWMMMLKTCKGAALRHRRFWRVTSEDLEAWRQLTEKYDPNMRTRFAGQLMSILSFSLQNYTTKRITAWGREIATHERDSGKVVDDEIKIGTFLLRLPESQQKTHLLMHVDTLKKWTDFRGKIVAISRATSAAQTQPTPMGSGAMSKGTPSKGSKGRRQTRQSSTASMSENAETQITLQRTALTSTRRAESAEKLVTLANACRSSGTAQPKAKGGGKKGKGGKSGGTVKTCWNCGENAHMSSQCPKKGPCGGR